MQFLEVSITANHSYSLLKPDVPLLPAVLSHVSLIKRSIWKRTVPIRNWLLCFALTIPTTTSQLSPLTPEKTCESHRDAPHTSRVASSGSRIRTHMRGFSPPILNPRNACFPQSPDLKSYAGPSQTAVSV
jgi:hypothetical protein